MLPARHQVYFYVHERVDFFTTQHRYTSVRLNLSHPRHFFCSIGRECLSERAALYVELWPGGTATRSSTFCWGQKPSFICETIRHNWHLGIFEPPSAQSWVTISRPFIVLPTTMRACVTRFYQQHVYMYIYAKTELAHRFCPAAIASVERGRDYPFIRLWNVEQFLQRASPNPSVCYAFLRRKFICARERRREGGARQKEAQLLKG